MHEELRKLYGVGVRRRSLNSGSKLSVPACFSSPTECTEGVERLLGEYRSLELFRFSPLVKLGVDHIEWGLIDQGESVHGVVFEFGLLGVLHLQVHFTTGLGHGVCIWDGAR
jgi:hypothetical protein